MTEECLYVIKYDIPTFDSYRKYRTHISTMRRLTVGCKRSLLWNGKGVIIAYKGEQADVIIRYLRRQKVRVEAIRLAREERPRVSRGPP
ncbi:MAG: hypothetical protein QXH97_00200 [Candidatus Bathyarchaeia archaeon]